MKISASDHLYSDARPQAAYVISYARRALPYLACIIPLALYQVLYSNGFFPITEGWFSEYAHLIRGGLMPYRDFSLLLPPLYSLQLAAFQMLFGEGYFALHVLGIFVTCGIALALLDLLKNFFDPWICAVAAAVGTVYYESGVAFIGYDFTQFLTLYILLASVFLVRSVRSPATESGDNTLWQCAFAGLFLGLAFLTKQSNAAVAALVLGVSSTVLAFALYRPKAAALRVAALIAGFLVPLAATAAWLALNRAFTPFITDVFINAASAKGGVKIALFTWVWYFYHDPAFLSTTIRTVLSLLELVVPMMIMAGILEGIVAVQRRAKMQRPQAAAAIRRVVGWAPSGKSPTPIIAFVTLGALCAIVLIIAFRKCSDCPGLIGWGNLVLTSQFNWAVNFYFVGFVISLVILLVRRQASAARFFMLAALGTGLTFGNGTSAGLSEISMFVGVAALLAFAMNAWSRYLFPALLPAAVALSLCLVLVEKKFDAPYTWWSVATPPVQTDSCAPARGLLQGLCLPQRDYASIERIGNAIEADSSPGEPIYVYPHMPFFYLMTDRPPFDNAVVSWFDFTSAREALKVSRDLRAKTPAVIVFAEIPDYVLSDHEKTFNAGKPLGQRSILKSIADLRRNGRIALVLRVRGLDGTDIDVYKRTVAAALGHS